MSQSKWRALQVASILVAVLIIYITYSNGFATATTGKDINVLLYVTSIFVSIGLVGLSIYFSIKAKKP